MNRPSWIWMTGIDTAVADTVQDPVTPEDDWASVPEIFKEHAVKIKELKKELISDPLCETDMHDELLWDVRFLLSHKQRTKRALQTAKQALLFTKKHNWDELDGRSHVPHKT